MQCGEGVMKTLMLISMVLGAVAAMIPGGASADPAAHVLGEVKFRFDSASLLANAPRLLEGAVRFAAAPPRPARHA